VSGEGTRACAAGQDTRSTEDGHTERAGGAVADTARTRGQHQDQGRTRRREPRTKAAREAGQAKGEAATRRGRQAAQVTGRCRRRARPVNHRPPMMTSPDVGMLDLYTLWYCYPLLFIDASARAD